MFLFGDGGEEEGKVVEVGTGEAGWIGGAVCVGAEFGGDGEGVRVCGGFAYDGGGTGDGVGGVCVD